MAGFLQLNSGWARPIRNRRGRGSFVVQLLASRNFGFFGASVVVLSLTLAGLLMASEHLFYYLFILSRHAGSQAAQTARSFLSAAPRPRKGERATRRGAEATPFPEAESAHADDALEAPFMPARDEAETRRDGAADRGARIHIRGSHANDIRPGDDVQPAEEPFPFDAVPETEEDEPAGEETSLAIDLDPPEADAPWITPSATPEADKRERWPGMEADVTLTPRAKMRPMAKLPSPWIRRTRKSRRNAQPSGPEPASARGWRRRWLPAAARARFRARTPRRRCGARGEVIEHEELPPDYEYPRHYTRPPLISTNRKSPYLPNLTEQLRETSILLKHALTFASRRAPTSRAGRRLRAMSSSLRPASRWPASGARRRYRPGAEGPPHPRRGSHPRQGPGGIEALMRSDQVLVREFEAPHQRQGKLNLVLERILRATSRSPIWPPCRTPGGGATGPW